jgi:hypothetical protein
MIIWPRDQMSTSQTSKAVVTSFKPYKGCLKGWNNMAKKNKANTNLKISCTFF